MCPHTHRTWWFRDSKESQLDKDFLERLFMLQEVIDLEQFIVFSNLSWIVFCLCLKYFFKYQFLLHNFSNNGLDASEDVHDDDASDDDDEFSRYCDDFDVWPDNAYYPFASAVDEPSKVKAKNVPKEAGNTIWRTYFLYYVFILCWLIFYFFLLCECKACCL